MRTTLDLEAAGEPGDWSGSCRWAESRLCSFAVNAAAKRADVPSWNGNSAATLICLLLVFKGSRMFDCIMGNWVCIMHPDPVKVTFFWHPYPDMLLKKCKHVKQDQKSLFFCFLYEHKWFIRNLKTKNVIDLREKMRSSSDYSMRRKNRRLKKYLRDKLPELLLNLALCSSWPKKFKQF